jgi:CheY-like chemotaxis protein
MPRLMVVDDDTPIRELYEEFVAAGGHELVGSAASGQEAVDAVRAMLSPPDLVLMDHRMPGKTGLEATREIRALRPHTKVLMVTADQTVLEKCKDNGASGYLEKPCSMGQLLAAIDMALAGDLSIEFEMSAAG